MTTLALDPNATVLELIRDRIAISQAISVLMHPSCSLPEPVRAVRLADLRDALNIHRDAMGAAYARLHDGPDARTVGSVAASPCTGGRRT